MARETDRETAPLSALPAYRRLAGRQAGETDDGDDWEFKVEADWTGELRVLAASC
jgi:hypothetical protein